MDSRVDFTILLQQATRGDRAAAERIAPIVYQTLQSLAECRRRERRGHTLETSDLINEAYLKLFGSSDGKEWANREHFVSVAARAMRSILVDHVRRKMRLKRSPAGQRVWLDDLVDHYSKLSGDLDALDHALTELAVYDPKALHVVELRFFAGLKVSEIAATVNTPLRTVERKLKMARAWLREEMARGS